MRTIGDGDALDSVHAALELHRSIHSVPGHLRGREGVSEREREGQRETERDSIHSVPGHLRGKAGGREGGREGARERERAIESERESRHLDRAPSADASTFFKTGPSGALAGVPRS